MTSPFSEEYLSFLNLLNQQLILYPFRFSPFYKLSQIPPRFVYDRVGKMHEGITLLEASVTRYLPLFLMGRETPFDVISGYLEKPGATTWVRRFDLNSLTSVANRSELANLFVASTDVHLWSPSFVRNTAPLWSHVMPNNWGFMLTQSSTRGSFSSGEGYE